MKKKYLITSALPYVNGNLHLGHMVGCLIPSDVYARFCRAMGRDVLYVCGSDDHGTPAMIAAQKAGKSVEQYTAECFAAQKEQTEKLFLSLDGGYGRTHTDLQTKLVHNLFSRLDENGYIEEKATVQPYDAQGQAFLSDRQIEGTCPKCGYEKARGDQCGKCDSLLDPSDLIKPYVADSGSKDIEWRETKNLFYRNDKTMSAVADWFADNHGMWSAAAVSNTKKYLSEDIPNPSVTRDLSWGIPVNKPGYENKVFYVWFDAPWGYVSISQAANKEWADWWHGGENCHYAQFMGKDNTKFHSIFFPGQELALNENWKKVDQLKVMNFLNFEGGKVSKSLRNGIFANEALSEAPADCWRYAFMASAPETDDTDFTIQRFADIVNKDLNGILGNFVSRVCKITEKNFGTNVPKQLAISNGQLAIDENELNQKLSELTAALDACEFRAAVSALRGLWSAGNEYFAKLEPWTLVKNGDLDAAGAVLNECFQLIDFYARVSAPFIPAAAEKMRSIFSISDEQLAISNWPSSYERRIADGTQFAVPENLFARIDSDKVAEMTAKYVKK
ncbi:MAG: methionine--tRNA ligase [Rickettsiales bacterium]|jgi:methionyl-tRNA synthetase|nr:methionine--tRNA ligase [Rickettsiales bacterium]